MNIIPAQMFDVDIYHDVYKCEEYAYDEYTPITNAETLVPVMKKSMAASATVEYIIQQKEQKNLWAI